MTEQKETSNATKASCCAPRANTACGCVKGAATGSGVDRGCCCGDACECGDSCQCPVGCGCSK